MNELDEEGLAMNELDEEGSVINELDEEGSAMNELDEEGSAMKLRRLSGFRGRGWVNESTTYKILPRGS